MENLERLIKYKNKEFINIKSLDFFNLLKKVNEVNNSLKYTYCSYQLCLAILKQIKKMKSSIDFVERLIYLLGKPNFYLAETDMKNTKLSMFIDQHIDLGK